MNFDDVCRMDTQINAEMMEQDLENVSAALARGEDVEQVLAGSSFAFRDLVIALGADRFEGTGYYGEAVDIEMDLFWRTEEWDAVPYDEIIQGAAPARPRLR